MPPVGRLSVYAAIRLRRASGLLARCLITRSGQSDGPRADFVDGARRQGRAPVPANLLVEKQNRYRFERAAHGGELVEEVAARSACLVHAEDAGSVRSATGGGPRGTGPGLWGPVLCGPFTGPRLQPTRPRAGPHCRGPATSRPPAEHGRLRPAVTP